MYQPSVRNFPNLAFLNLAFAAASTSEMAAMAARLFADFGIGTAAPPVHGRHRTRLHLNLKAFGCVASQPLQGAAMVDLAPGHSLVAALRRVGLRRLFVTDWRSAHPEMPFLGIDG